jgi:uncharacterized protein (DUF427 family)
MTEKTVKFPGPDHPITIEPAYRRVVVASGDGTVADTVKALVLREANYPPVQYIPRKDVDMSALVRSETTSYCPYKGQASYFSIPSGGGRSVDAVWTYDVPHEAVVEIKDHLAFYPDRVEGISESDI